MLMFQDRLEIAELLNRYLLAVDSHEADPWVTLFAPDGSFQNGPDRATGAAALRSFITGWHASGITASIHHYMGTYAIDGGGDTAQARSYYWAAEVLGPPRVVATGRFTDRLVRTAGSWRFAVREHELDPGFSASATTGAPVRPPTRTPA